MISTWLITLITFLIGYALGKYENPEVRKSVKVAIRNTKRKIKGEKIGAVQRLSAQEQRIRNNPILKGEEEAMTEVLDEVL